MAKPARFGKHWTKEEVQALRDLAKRNTPTRIIGLKLKRPPEGVVSKAHEKHIPLAPWNQSPYNRRKK